MREKILHWFGHGQVGLSSKCMAMHLCGFACDGSYPHDPADLNRCLLFLAAVPEARRELHQMARVNVVWASLVARWADIEALFLSEAGLDWTKSGRAPRTYALMQEVIESAERVLSECSHTETKRIGQCGTQPVIKCARCGAETIDFAADPLPYPPAVVPGQAVEGGR